MRASGRALTVVTLGCAAAALPVQAATPKPPARALRRGAAREVRLKASFSPERLGRETTVSVAFRITGAPGTASSPVREVKLYYPAELGIATSELGQESCTAEDLQRAGVAGCGRNALMGYGSAQVEVPFGPKRVFETAPITILSQPVREGSLGLLFYASGDFPVIANLVFGGVVLDAGGRYGGMLDTRLPLVPSVPEGPDVALVALDTTIGPRGITYFETVRGETVKFKPRGILLPARCPRRGFPFRVRVRFEDGGWAGGETAVRCPGARGG